ncbi:MAG: hypothetical protein NC489_18515 [Ruminococcus flavefaciens]|nr:hypothetical protein [Ruminococcus flavefaciens]
MRGKTNINNKSNDSNVVSPFRFILSLNNSYQSTGTSFVNRNYSYFSLPIDVIKKYKTLKVLRTECGTDRSAVCDARIHYCWDGTYVGIHMGITDYDGDAIYTFDISNVDWEYINEKLGGNIVGISGIYNAYAKVLFELS